MRPPSVVWPECSALLYSPLPSPSSRSSLWRSLLARSGSNPQPMSARAPASARGLPSARGGPLRERPQLSSRTNQPGGWWANMQKSANPGGQTARAARPVVQLDGRRPNTARGASETPTRSTRPAYGSPAQDLGNFQLRVTSSATLLIGAGEPEDCVLTKGASRVGLALWHECVPALKPQRAWADWLPTGSSSPL